MLDTDERATAPVHPPAGGVFNGLKPGEKVYVRPAIPRPSEQHEYQVQHVEAGSIVIRKRSTDAPLSISAAAVARFHLGGEQTPAVLVLKGRLQWITAAREWMILPEELPPDSEHGFHKLASASDPQVVDFIERLRQLGFSPWWVPADGVQEFLAQGGEIIYDADGCYLRIRDRRSEWILLGRAPGPAPASLP